MKAATIYCVSASDRYNYGDLLFPIVAKWQLASIGPCDFVNVATVDSDLSNIGALPTRNYGLFLDPEQYPKDSMILIAGGQVLNGDWLKIISFIKPRWYDFINKYEGDSLKRKMYRRFKLSNEPLPFIPSADELINNNTVVYHAVGGGVPKLKPKRRLFDKAVKACAYMSVRDNWTQRVLRGELKHAAKLVPDSVITYSDLMPKSQVTKQTDEPYICVQFGYQKSVDKLDIILAQLKQIHLQTGYKIGLLSIGNCPGHDDIVAANWIRDRADFPVFHLKHDHIDDITSALAHAKMFVGTSLHGVILSMTYGNPFVAVDKKINKLDAYTKTWAPDYLKGCVEHSDIAQAAKTRMAAHVDYLPLIEKQKELVRASFKHIYSLLR